MSKRTIIFCVVGVAVLVGIYFVADKKEDTQPTPATTPIVSTSWPADEVKKVQIKDSGTGYTINVFYPQTKSDVISGYMHDFATDQIIQFKQDTAWTTDPNLPKDTVLDTSLSIDYTSEKSPTVETYIFTVSSDTGGAHPLTTTRTFSYVKEGTPLTLDTLFTNKAKGIAALSTYAIDYLEKKAVSDNAWIKDGAGPTEDNYQTFSVEDGNLFIYFDPYQVAPYSDGLQKVVVPFSALTPYLSSTVISQ